MSQLQIKRVLALPLAGALLANTMYLVAASEAAHAEVVFTGSTNDVVKRVINQADVEALIAGATSSGADKLTTPRTITATGDGDWEVTFDGSANVSAVFTLADTTIVPGTYSKTTFDSKGRATAGAQLAAADIPDLPGTKITSDISVNTTGNAATATALETSRTINGVAFDGTSDIVIEAVDSIARIAVSEKGQADGVASLDGSGRVPAGQLPSYVDDVLEFADLATFPAEGEAGKIYVALDSNKVYRWSGSTYIQVNDAVSTSDTAETLATARNIAISGAATGTTSFDGSQNVDIALTLAAVGTAGEQGPVVTTNAAGQVASSRALVAADIPELDYTTVVSAGSVWVDSPEW